MAAKKKASAVVASILIGASLYLVTQKLPKLAAAAKPAKPPPTHHIAVVDMSGSMWLDIPKMRDDLKAKLPKMLAEGDTFSCIGFSGRGECFVILEGEEIRDGKDLSTTNKLLDRWFKTIGLTGFKEPLEEAKALIGRLQAKKPGLYNMFFMSDGCDNQWRREEILKAAKEVGGVASACTIVEYGFYADRAMLAAMAQEAGGAHIFAEDFPKFMAVMEKSLQSHPSSEKRVEVNIGADAIGGFVFALDNGDVPTFGLTGTTCAVPESIEEIHYLSPTPVGDVLTTRNDFAAHYAALSLYATRMNSDVVFAILKDLADVTFIDSFCNCFGKQAYSDFSQAALDAAFDVKLRFKKGRDPNRIPREDAYTVLDLLNGLEDDEARLLLDSDKFRYSKIGRGRLDAEEGEDGALTFTRAEKPNGYTIDALTFNQTRPNISFRTVREGTLNIRAKDPERKYDKVPDELPSFQHRNYAAVKDGLVNIERLPARISKKFLASLDAMYKDGLVPFGVVEDWPKTVGETVDVVFDLRAIPIMNRKSVKATSALDYFKKNYELTKQKARQKVFNDYKKEKASDKRNEGYEFVYGKEAAEFLKSVGIDQFNGYAPPHTVTAAPSGDFYMSKEMECKLAGLSSLCKVEEAKAGKGGASGAMMRPAIAEIEEFLASKAYTGAADPQAVLDAWLIGAQKAVRAKTRSLILDMAKTTFNVIVGQIWFNEFASLSEDSMEIEVDGAKIKAQAKVKEVKVLL